MFGVSKQAYYKHDESKVLRKAAQESFVLEYVKGIRKKDPGIGGKMEDVLINGEPSGEFYYRPTGKTDYSTMNTVTAALRCFMEGNGFEDVVRRAVAMGGDSTTIASMAGAVAHAFYRDIPEEIVKQCVKVMETDLRNTMDSYERSLTSIARS